MTSRTDHDLAPGLVDQVASLASGATSSVAATEATLSRIEATQPHLNAFKIVRREKALKEAAEADRRLALGERLPLLGVPIAVKDDVDITGEPTAFGCPGDFPAKTEDSEMIRRLRDAGAVIVGKTNSPELGQWPLTSGSAFGYTRNPWSRHHTPGGSSGGTAAAVAAGLVSAGIGSDGAGSIRIPAAWTNLVGIKPQRGRISTWPDAEAFYGLTVNGPLARTVADAALLLDVAAGNHDGDLHKPPPHDRRSRLATTEALERYGSTMTRKVRLRRSPMGLVVLGIWWCQHAWVGPRMTSRLPGSSSISWVSEGSSRWRNRNGRRAPKLTDAITGSTPSSGSSSLCQATLSAPSRKRLHSTLLNATPASGSTAAFTSSSAGVHRSGASSMFEYV